MPITTTTTKEGFFAWLAENMREDYHLEFNGCSYRYMIGIVCVAFFNTETDTFKVVRQDLI